MDASQADEILSNALSEAWDGGIVTGWVVIACGIDEEGEPRRYFNVMDGQTSTTTLGLLEGFTAIQKKTMVDHWLED